MNEVNATIAKFGHPETLIREYEHWVVLFRTHQITVGSVIIAAKSSATRLGELSAEIWAEFSNVTEEVEGWLSDSFNAQKFNYLALMMKDPNVHFHVVPRYDAPVIVDNKEFIDADWPLKTEMKETEMSDDTKRIIMQTILEKVA